MAKLKSKQWKNYALMMKKSFVGLASYDSVTVSFIGKQFRNETSKLTVPNCSLKKVYQGKTSLDSNFPVTVDEKKIRTCCSFVEFSQFNSRALTVFYNVKFIFFYEPYVLLKNYSINQE